MPFERQPVDLDLGVSRRTSRFAHDHGRVRAGILPARGPAEKPELLNAVVAGNEIDPVPRLQPADEGQRLVRGEIERVERRQGRRIANQGKEAERTVDRPLDDDGVPAFPRECLDERGKLPLRFEAVPVRQEDPAIILSGGKQRLPRVVEQVDAARDPGGSRCHGQGRTACEIALLSLDSPGREEG